MEQDEEEEEAEKDEGQPAGPGYPGGPPGGASQLADNPHAADAPPAPQLSHLLTVASEGDLPVRYNDGPGSDSGVGEDDAPSAGRGWGAPTALRVRLPEAASASRTSTSAGPWWPESNQDAWPAGAASQGSIDHAGNDGNGDIPDAGSVSAAAASPAAAAAADTAAVELLPGSLFRGGVPRETRDNETSDVGDQHFHTQLHHHHHHHRDTVPWAGPPLTLDFEASAPDQVRLVRRAHTRLAVGR